MNSKTASILIIDDDQYLREEIEHVVKRIGCRALHAGSISECRTVLKDSIPWVILLDIQLPDGSGLDILPDLMKLDSRPEVVVISGAASLQEAADSIKIGATDFLEKPFEPDRLAATLNNIIRLARLKRENRHLMDDRLRAYEIVGISDAVKKLRERINQIASTDARVLITGESGTGKELVAGQIHYRSRRASGNYVQLNCSTLPRELAESELFGHEKGAFTGASERRIGRFEAADGGTLLLDEIGDMPTDLQPKLLRVLESGEFQRVGSTESIRCDVRVLSSTNKNLTDRIKEGTFREDLYYRLCAVPIEIPPLRERREDIPPLAGHFLSRLTDSNVNPVRIEDSALNALTTHGWPGNVRQLKNVIEQVYWITDSESITGKDIRTALGLLESDDSAIQDGSNRLAVAVEGFERAYLGSRLDSVGGNVSELARSLGIDRGNLHRKLKKLGLL